MANTSGHVSVGAHGGRRSGVQIAHFSRKDDANGLIQTETWDQDW